MTKLAKKKPAIKSPVAKTPGKISVKKSAINKTAEEKRLARNESLRAWRKANRDKVNAYMKAWHAAKKTAQEKDGPKKKAVTK